MPIAGVEGGKGPDNPLSCQTGSDMRIIDNVREVVKVDKIMTARLPEDGQNSDNQGQAYEKLTTHE
jgi:hypothetical protein